MRLTPEMSANSPIFAVMRNIIPAAGGRYINDVDVDRRRRVVFLGDKLKKDLFGDEEAVGKTVMIDNTPFLVIGVMQEKAQDSSYSGRDKDKAFVPESTYRGLFTERYVDNFIFQAKDAAMVPEVTRKVYEVLGRRHKFDPTDKEAIGMWDTTEGEKFFRVFFGVFRAFLAIIGSFTLIVGGIGVSNIMYVVVEERTREIGVKLAVGAKPRFILGQFLVETLTLTAVGGVPRLPDHARRHRGLPGPARRVRGHARGLAPSSSSPPPPCWASSASPPAISPRGAPRCSTPWWR